MRTIVNNILIGLIILIGGSIHSSAQNSKTSGDWENKNTWEGNASVPLNIKNNYSFGSINIIEDHFVQIGLANNLKDLIVDKNEFQLNVSGDLTIYGNLEAKNSLTINIAPGARLTIIGSIDVNNGLVVNVSEGGTFIIKGTVKMNNNATIEVDGDLVADAIIGNNGNTISGNGTLYVDTISGVETDSTFKGTIVGDDTNLYFASPENLTAEVSGELKVSLNWDFTNVAVDDYEFVGFQVFRNLGGNLHYDEIIFGVIIDGNFSGDTSTLYNDPYAHEPGATPKYYVRAVYRDLLLKSETYLFSPVSNNVDFSDAPLPIELMYFTAETSNNVVNLIWATATEINNDFFTIERSTNGLKWEIIDYARGAGNANYTINYNYTDNNPVAGISYYRLKQTDFDGKFEYFAPVAVEFNQMKNAAAILNVTYTAQKMDIYVANENPNAYLLVSDIQGRIIGQYQIGANDYTQSISVNFPRNYSGEIVMVRLVSNDKSDEKKYIIR